jgi:hypothetical protein
MASTGFGGVNNGKYRLKFLVCRLMNMYNPQREHTRFSCLRA